MSRLSLLLVLLAAPALAADPQAGKATYTAKCLACHGADGKGNGPAAAALPKRPPDMTTAAFWDGMTDERLRSVITSGKPGGVMRPFPMKDDQMNDLIAYLRTLRPQ